jgi:hypothetical protein
LSIDVMMGLAMLNQEHGLQGSTLLLTPNEKLNGAGRRAGGVR